MRISPGFRGTKGSTLPDSVLWTRISCMTLRLSLSTVWQTNDCSRGVAGAAMTVAGRVMRCKSLQLTVDSSQCGRGLGAEAGIGAPTIPIREGVVGGGVTPSPRVFL